jgi:hypothetical protein
MERQVTGFHQDEEGHWVAELECGHNQHVRHDPPWECRPWVVTPEGRRSRLGMRLNCVARAQIAVPQPGRRGEPLFIQVAGSNHPAQKVGRRPGRRRLLGRCNRGWRRGQGRVSGLMEGLSVPRCIVAPHCMQCGAMRAGGAGCNHTTMQRGAPAAAPLATSPSSSTSASWSMGLCATSCDDGTLRTLLVPMLRHSPSCNAL